MEKTLKELILHTIRKSDGMTFENLLDEFMSSSEQQIQETIDTLVADEIIWLEEGLYTYVEKENMVIGRFIANEKGFGFVERIDSELEDIYIDTKLKKDALHHDIVLVKVKKMRAKSDEGKIIKIIDRGIKRVVGTFRNDTHGSYVIPDEKKLPLRIFIPSDYQLQAVDGHKVVAEVYEYLADGHTKGTILHVIGHVNDPGVDILSIVHKREIPHEFDPSTLAEANTIPDTVPAADIQGRRDLRREKIMTIDGADAKDLDDAVHVKRLDNGNYLLGVHIADVSHYVKKDSAMDKEAFLRGTSVYLVDRVIPMIPHRLSNGICSLNPRVDRLTLSCEMEFSPTGELVHYEIFESVINTTERMTYDDVNALMERSDEQVLARYNAHLPFFKTMFELSHILRTTRTQAGAIDFDINETKIYVDEACKPLEIKERVRGEAERLIEDFMLAANDTVAMHLSTQNLPGLYRVHTSPNPAKLHHFANFISTFGYRFVGSVEEVKPKQLQTVLKKIKGTPEEKLISKVLLRSMSQAKYAADNLGHFGLAKENYTHFTSPIRRYPDLIVHRLIREFILTKKDPQSISYSLEEIAEQTSVCERRAVDAERETQELKKTEYMVPHVGESFQATISSVTKFGFFIELPNTIEGLVHIATLKDDHYEFDEEKLHLIGKNKKKRFSLGDAVEVTLTKANVEERKLYFEPVAIAPPRPKKEPTDAKTTEKPYKAKKQKASYKDRFGQLYK